MKYINYLLILLLVFATGFTFAQSTFNSTYPPIQKQFGKLHKFGLTVTDDFSNLNNLEDPIVIDWFKAQDSLAEIYFSGNELFEDYLLKFQEYEDREGGSISMIQINEKGNYFYLKYDEKSGKQKLYFRENLSAEEKEILDTKDYLNITEITYLKPSFDGNKIAIGYHTDENFTSTVRILNIKSREFYEEEITHINPAFGGIEWLPDSSGFIYLYFPVVDQQDPNYKKNSFSVLHRLGSDPDFRIKVFGNNEAVNIPADFYPKVKIGSSNDKYILGYSASANDYYDAYVAKISDLISGKINWQPFFKVEDQIYTTEGTLKGDEFIYRKGNETGNQICQIKLHSLDFNNSEIIAAGTQENPINQIKVTKDHVYYSRSKFGVEVSLWKIDKQKNTTKLQTPFVAGYATFFGGSVKTNLIGVELDGWISNYTRFLINDSAVLQKEGLQAESFYPEFKNLISEQIMVKSHDGIEVPLSLVYNPKTIQHKENEVFMYVYGAYGDNLSPFFYPIFLDWTTQGGILAFPHVRGGGEKGKAWHLQGQKALKYNSWKDLITCTEALIEKGFTKKGLISLYTSSAGGITAGMAVNERPDLFSSFIAEVPRLNPLGLESSQTVSSTSYLEYGSVNDSLEFKGLAKMDPYHNLTPGNEYPPTLVISAAQDDRIPLWDSGKYIAKLQSIANRKIPILLDIHYQSSHDNLGTDSTVKLYSKIFTFAKSNMSRY